MARVVQDEQRVLTQVVEIRDFLFHLRRLLMDGEQFEGMPLANMIQTPRRIVEKYLDQLPDDHEEAKEGLRKAIKRLTEFRQFLVNYPEMMIHKELLDRPLFEVQFGLDEVAEQLKEDYWKKFSQKSDEDGR